MKNQMSHRLSGNGFAFASMVLWSTALPATEVLLQSWHPLAISVGRLVLGGVALTCALVVMGRTREIRHAPWKDIFYIGGLGLGGATIFLNWGLVFSNPTTAAIILTSMPAVALVFGVIRGEERVSIRLLTGIGLALIGGAWASLSGRADIIGLEGGEFAILLSVIFFVWYSRAAVRRLSMLSATAKSGLTLSMGGVVVGGVVIASQLLGVETVNFETSPISMALILWIACICNGFAMILWLTGVERIGMVITSIHMNMVPFYVMLCVLALGGTVSFGQTSGALLVVIGVVISQWQHTKND